MLWPSATFRRSVNRSAPRARKGRTPPRRRSGASPTGVSGERAGDAAAAAAATGAGQRERFRRNRAQSVLIGRGRSAVLIPVNRIADRATGGGAGIAERQIALARPPDAAERVISLVQVVTELVSRQEGIGDATQRVNSAAERRRSELHVHGGQKI